MRKTLDRRGFLGAGVAATAGIATLASRAYGAPVQSGTSQAVSSQAQDNTYKVLQSIKDFEKVSYVDSSSENKAADTGDYEVKVDCALGTNPLGYSPTLSDAIAAVSKVDINSYPAFPYNDFKKDIAESWKDCASLTGDNILVHTGSMGVLELINKAFIQSGSKELGYTPQFSDYVSDVRSLGGVYDSYQLDHAANMKFDADALIRKITPEHSLVYIDNPNNPTGQIIPLEDIERIVKAADAKGVCVIVDEAYGDFMDRANSGINLIGKYKNVIATRSFSKGFGLAGLRIGYLISSVELTAMFNKINLPFAVSNYAAYLAPTVLKDLEFVEYSKTGIKDRKRKILSAKTRLKFMETSDTVPVFFARHPDENVHLYTELLKHGVKTEDGANFENAGKNYARVRTPKEIDYLIEVFERI